MTRANSAPSGRSGRSAVISKTPNETGALAMRMVTRAPGATCAARVCRTGRSAADAAALTAPSAVSYPPDRSFGREIVEGEGTVERIENPAYEQASPDAMRALQLRRLREMLRFTAATNVFYRERWQAAGLDVEQVDSLDGLRRLATVEKHDFVADQLQSPPFGRRLERAFALGERLEIYTTSGTSGQ